MQFTLNITTSLAIDDAEFSRLGGTKITALHLEEDKLDLVCEGSPEAIKYATSVIYAATH
jgi:hypothetical protein